MKHTAVYIRVSSAQQDTKSQEPDLKRFVGGQDTPVVWYSDKFTGKTMDRPGWNKLTRAIEAGEVSRVVVWRLDRLGRTAKGLTALFTDLTERSVNLVSMKDSIDLETASGRLMANVLASVAQYETEVRAERVRAGQAVAKASGKSWGGSKAGRMLSVTVDQVETIHKLKAEGKSVASISRSVSLSRPTIYHYLKSVG